MLKKVFLLIPMAWYVACTPGKPQLPAVRPSDFTINYRVDGGMSDYSVDIKVFADSCTYKKRQDGKVAEKRFKLSDPDLNMIYNMVRQSEFDQIESLTEKDFVYDRGGETITAGWNKTLVTVSNAQNNFVKEKWYEKWKMLCEGLDEFIAKKIGT